MNWTRDAGDKLARRKSTKRKTKSKKKSGLVLMNCHYERVNGQCREICEDSKGNIMYRRVSDHYCQIGQSHTMEYNNEYETDDYPHEYDDD